MTATFSKDKSIHVVGVAADRQELLALCGELEPDVVITNPKLLDANGIASIRKRTGELPDIKIIAFAGGYSDSDIKLLLEADSEGYLFYDLDDDELIAAVRSVYDYHCVIVAPVQSRIGKMACANIRN